VNVKKPGEIPRFLSDFLKLLWESLMDEDFKAWIGRTEASTDPLAWTQAQAVQAMLDDPGPALVDGDPLPHLWHWFHFLPRASQCRLDTDGHPQRGGFLPPIPYPRRMFAGARLKWHRPLLIGTPAQREASISNVVLKSGKSGSLAFVTVALRFLQAGQLCIEEEQDIVYREPGGRVTAPVTVASPPLPPGSWTRTLLPDSRLLFRFSALTFNAHRIHYDRSYASDVEGYPGLVVHGPLTAVLLAQLVALSTTRPIRSFSFRGVAPLFDLGPIRLVGQAEGDTVALEAQGPDGTAGLLASATLG
jgi:3-methylfumaryl-CoA hydratase